MEHTLTWCGFTLTVAAHSVRGESTTEATGQHELGGVQSSDGGQPHGAAQGPRRLPVLLSQSGNLQFTLKILHFMFKLCQVSNCEINYEIYNMTASCYTRQTKGR